MRQSQPMPMTATQNPLTIEATRTWNEMTGGMLCPSDVYSMNKALVKTLERYEGQLPSMLKATQKKKKSKKAKKAPSNDQSPEQKASVKANSRRSQSVTGAKRTAVSRQSRQRSSTTKDDSLSKTRANSVWKKAPQVEYRVKNSEAESAKEPEQKAEKKKRRRNNRNRRKNKKDGAEHDTSQDEQSKVSHRKNLSNL